MASPNFAWVQSPSRNATYPAATMRGAKGKPVSSAVTRCTVADELRPLPSSPASGHRPTWHVLERRGSHEMPWPDGARFPSRSHVAAASNRVPREMHLTNSQQPPWMLWRPNHHQLPITESRGVVSGLVAGTYVIQTKPPFTCAIHLRGHRIPGGGERRNSGCQTLSGKRRAMTSIALGSRASGRFETTGLPETWLVGRVAKCSRDSKEAQGDCRPRTCIYVCMDGCTCLSSPPNARSGTGTRSISQPRLSRCPAAGPPSPYTSARLRIDQGPQDRDTFLIRRKSKNSQVPTPWNVRHRFRS